MPFAVYKIVSLFVVLSLYYLVCMAIQIAILDFNFGTECLKTYIQMLFSAFGLIPCDLGQLQLAIVIGGLCSILCAVAFTLFISGKAKITLTSILISIVIALLPTILYTVAGISWLVYILPSSGIGMQNSLLYQLIDINFLSMGKGGCLDTVYNHWRSNC